MLRDTADFALILIHNWQELSRCIRSFDTGSGFSGCWYKWLPYWTDLNSILNQSPTECRAGQQRLKADHVELLHVAMPTASEAETSQLLRAYPLKKHLNYVKTNQNISELSPLLTFVTHATMLWFSQDVCQSLEHSACESCKVKFVSVGDKAAGEQAQGDDSNNDKTVAKSDVADVEFDEVAVYCDCHCQDPVIFQWVPMLHGIARKRLCAMWSGGTLWSPLLAWTKSVHGCFRSNTSIALHSISRISMDLHGCSPNSCLVWPCAATGCCHCVLWVPPGSRPNPSAIPDDHQPSPHKIAYSMDNIWLIYGKCMGNIWEIYGNI